MVQLSAVFWNCLLPALLSLCNGQRHVARSGSSDGQFPDFRSSQIRIRPESVSNFPRGRINQLRGLGTGNMLLERNIVKAYVKKFNSRAGRDTSIIYEPFFDIGGFINGEIGRRHKRVRRQISPIGQPRHLHPFTRGRHTPAQPAPSMEHVMPLPNATLAAGDTKLPFAHYNALLEQNQFPPAQAQLSSANRQPTGTQANRQPTGTQANRQPTGTQANRQPTGTQANRQTTGTQANSNPFLQTQIKKIAEARTVLELLIKKERAQAKGKQIQTGSPTSQQSPIHPAPTNQNPLNNTNTQQRKPASPHPARKQNIQVTHTKRAHPVPQQQQQQYPFPQQHQQPAPRNQQHPVPQQHPQAVPQQHPFQQQHPQPAQQQAPFPPQYPQPASQQQAPQQNPHAALKQQQQNPQPVSQQQQHPVSQQIPQLPPQAAPPPQQQHHPIQQQHPQPAASEQHPVPQQHSPPAPHQQQQQNHPVSQKLRQLPPQPAQQQQYPVPQQHPHPVPHTQQQQNHPISQKLPHLPSQPAQQQQYPVPQQHPHSVPNTQQQQNHPVSQHLPHLPSQPAPPHQQQQHYPIPQQHPQPAVAHPVPNSQPRFSQQQHPVLQHHSKVAHNPNTPNNKQPNSWLPQPSTIPPSHHTQVRNTASPPFLHPQLPYQHMQHDLMFNNQHAHKSVHTTTSPPPQLSQQLLNIPHQQSLNNNQPNTQFLPVSATHAPPGGIDQHVSIQRHNKYQQQGFSPLPQQFAHEQINAHIFQQQQNQQQSIPPNLEFLRSNTNSGGASQSGMLQNQPNMMLQNLGNQFTAPNQQISGQQQPLLKQQQNQQPLMGRHQSHNNQQLGQINQQHQPLSGHQQQHHQMLNQNQSPLNQQHLTNNPIRRTSHTKRKHHMRRPKTTNKPPYTNPHPQYMNPQSVTAKPRHMDPYPQYMNPQSVTAKPRPMDPYPQYMNTKSQYTNAPHPLYMTQNPHDVTPHVHYVTHNPQYMPPRPQTTTPKPQTMTLKPHHITKRPQYILPNQHSMTPTPPQHMATNQRYPQFTPTPPPYVGHQQHGSPQSPNMMDQLYKMAMNIPNTAHDQSSSKQNNRSPAHKRQRHHQSQNKQTQLIQPKSNNPPSASEQGQTLKIKGELASMFKRLQTVMQNLKIIPVNTVDRKPAVTKSQATFNNNRSTFTPYSMNLIGQRQSSQPSQALNAFTPLERMKQKALSNVQDSLRALGIPISVEAVNHIGNPSQKRVQATTAVPTVLPQPSNKREAHSITKAPYPSMRLWNPSRITTNGQLTPTEWRTPSPSKSTNSVNNWLRPGAFLNNARPNQQNHGKKPRGDMIHNILTRKHQNVSKKGQWKKPGEDPEKRRKTKWKNNVSRNGRRSGRRHVVKSSLTSKPTRITYAPIHIPSTTHGNMFLPTTYIPPVTMGLTNIPTTSPIWDTMIETKQPPHGNNQQHHLNHVLQTTTRRPGPTTTKSIIQQQNALNANFDLKTFLNFFNQHLVTNSTSKTSDRKKNKTINITKTVRRIEKPSAPANNQPSRQPASPSKTTKTPSAPVNTQAGAGAQPMVPAQHMSESPSMPAFTIVDTQPNSSINMTQAAQILKLLDALQTLQDAIGHSGGTNIFSGITTAPTVHIVMHPTDFYHRKARCKCFPKNDGCPADLKEEPLMDMCDVRKTTPCCDDG